VWQQHFFWQCVACVVWGISLKLSTFDVLLPRKADKRACRQFQKQQQCCADVLSPRRPAQCVPAALSLVPCVACSSLPSSPQTHASLLHAAVAAAPECCVCGVSLHHGCRDNTVNCML
jgi:hypothetical protein